MQVIPYLSFNGNCEEAVNFYVNSFGGKITELNRYADSPMESSEAQKNQIMHTEFQLGDSTIYAADNFEGQPYIPGNTVSLTVNCDTEQRIEAMYATLAADGMVHMPLQDTFWGAKFAALTDKFGITWGLNWMKPQS